MLFFFYGTLAEPETNRVSRMVHACLAPVGPATVHGKLYGIETSHGWYPALLPGSGAVSGMVFETNARFGDAELARIDQYEDFDPADPGRSLYIREEIEAALSGGTIQSVSTYRYNRLLPAGSRAIRGGDFLNWLQTESLRAYGA